MRFAAAPVGPVLVKDQDVSGRDRPTVGPVAAMRQRITETELIARCPAPTPSPSVPLEWREFEREINAGAMSRPGSLHRSDVALAGLRRRIAALEGGLSPEARLAPAPVSAKQGPARLLFGTPAIDKLFTCPGLPLGALHEMVSGETRDGGVLTGFLAAVLARLETATDGSAADGEVLWILDPRVPREGGTPYAEGLAHFGLDPSRLLIVKPRRIEDCLWAMEEGLRSPALGAVVGEIHGDPKPLDLTATRRLALRIRESRVTGFLLRHATPGGPSAAITRFRIIPRRGIQVESRRRDALLGEPGWRIALEKNRDGRPGTADLEWNHAHRCFTAATDRKPVVSDAADRPDSALLAG